MQRKRPLQATDEAAPQRNTVEDYVAEDNAKNLSVDVNPAELLSASMGVWQGAKLEGGQKRELLLLAMNRL
jgi:hypothetical protein